MDVPTNMTSRRTTIRPSIADVMNTVLGLDHINRRRTPYGFVHELVRLVVVHVGVTDVCLALLV